MTPSSPIDGAHVRPIHAAYRRRDTTSVIGMMIFIASWAMLFAALFMSYAVLRIRATVWPPADLPKLPIALPLIATAVIGLSSLSLERGLAQVRGGEPQRYLGHLLSTFILGSAFLVVQVTVWCALWRAGLTIRSGTYGGVFYLLTCFHALHVLVGLVFLGWLVPGSLRSLGLGAKLGRLGVITLYWHFVGVVWAVMFVAVYLL